MNAIILINGEDITDVCRLQETRINYDSTRRLTTASITVMGSPGNTRYDFAHYDEDSYGVTFGELFQVTILDGRDGVTKLFDGQIFSIELVQSDAPTFRVLYKCELNDWAAWLDRSVCWDSSYALPASPSDKAIIEALIGTFAPRITVVPANIAMVVPVIQSFEFKQKTCRQVLDDISALSLGEWRVDFDGILHYGLQSAAPAAPFNISTSPDNITTFPAAVSGYRHDFTNPINRAYVRGGVVGGIHIEASYTDPISVGQYGEYATAVVDEQIATAFDASLRAKSTVLKYAYPIEQGGFTLWRDGLAVGQKIHIVEENLGIDGDYTIRAISLQWETQDLVRYDVQFGAAKPDLELILRTLDMRSRWKSTNPSTTGGGGGGGGTPDPHSVSDESIVIGGLSASVINSINASTIIGHISAGQIGSVNAGVIVGVVSAGQIGSVNATSIQGAIVADQIGSINAATINGVVVSSQLADHIISDLAKYADELRPVLMMDVFPTAVLPDPNFPPNSFFYYIPDGHFYRIDPSGLTFSRDDNPQNVTAKFYHIGAISAGSITGLIVAAQIGSITAGQITGQISAGQIASVNASSISGQITATQIDTVDAASIQGTIEGSQINTVNAGSITGVLTADQIGQVNANTITLGSMSVGGVGAIAINVYNSSAVLVAKIGDLGGGFHGGWFQVFGAGGTGYANAKVKTDLSGNLTITDAAVNITGGASTISTSPSTFDASYGTLALNNADFTDRCAFISRGLVFYYGGSKIGSLVRSPFGGFLELDFTLPGGSQYVLISGANGIRSDSGYSVAGQTVINSSRQFVGSGVDVGSQGVRCGGVNPFSGGVDHFGFTGFIPSSATLNVVGGVIVGYS